ncbi:MAG: mannosyl-3-phosphoglycerate synthase, partial [Limisphaerales bacterium]
INGLQKVYELDGGEGVHGQDTVIERIPSEVLYDRMREMAIIVPVKDERLKLIEGVLVGIPSPCQVIVVSNSRRGSIDRFKMEKEALENYGKFAKKKILVVHQKDPALAQAFIEGSYETLIDDNSEVRSGKAEGMIIGTIMAKWLGKKYLGFVDSDNYFPGSVMEYVYEYAAGFSMNSNINTFVRISWHSKPKIIESNLFFAKWGRSSMNSNKMLNNLLSHFSGFETEIVKTGNAGEHALTTNLALKLEFASGYAVETNHFINLLEKYGGIIEEEAQKVKQENITVCQIESRNPHMHESKGDEHVEDMIDASLSVIYHSKLCPEILKQDIMENVRARRNENSPRIIEPIRKYPSLEHLDTDEFFCKWESLNFDALIIR